ncbi:MAG TPA: hypothetical protein VKR54_03050 [Candidatus Babeliales bacterium]|nr:hypothetical protein [Candidatus Babeliales bacterium]
MKNNNIFCCKKIFINFLPTLIAFFMLPLQAMNKEMTVDNKRIAWTVVLVNGKEWFSHDMIRSLAVSKDLDAVLRDTAQERKNYLSALVSPESQFIGSLNSCKSILKANSWHKYGTACGHVDHLLSSGPSEHEKKILILERWYLADKGAVKYYSAALNNFYGYLTSVPRGFFNDKDDFCFHGYGDKICWSGDIPLILLNKQVIEYSLSLDDSLKSLCCTMNGIVTRGLNLLLNFPLLLKAFLKSSKVFETGTTVLEHAIRVKLYSIDGVIIPENYREYEQYCPESLCNTFDDLPVDVQQAIVMRKKAYKK